MAKHKHEEHQEDVEVKETVETAEQAESASPEKSELELANERADDFGGPTLWSEFPTAIQLTTYPYIPNVTASTQ